MSDETETLREAAALMRLRAEEATPGPWSNRRGPGEHVVRTDSGAPLANTGTRADRRHIASWHPVVALAVADWLESEAQAKESADAWDAEIERDGLDWARERANFEVSVQALAVARAYLGGAR